MISVGHLELTVTEDESEGGWGQILLGLLSKVKRIGFYTKFHGMLFFILGVLLKCFKLENHVSDL